MSVHKNIKTRILEILADAPDGLCEHRFTDELPDVKPEKLMAVLEKLEKKNKIYTSLGNCTRVPTQHVIYNKEAEREKKQIRRRAKQYEEIKPSFDGTLVVVPKEDNTHTQITDLRNLSVDELSEEIYARCKEIQDRLRGGSWVFRNSK